MMTSFVKGSYDSSHPRNENNITIKDINIIHFGPSLSQCKNFAQPSVKLAIIYLILKIFSRVETSIKQLKSTSQCMLHRYTNWFYWRNQRVVPDWPQLYSIHCNAFHQHLHLHLKNVILKWTKRTEFTVLKGYINGNEAEIQLILYLVFRLGCTFEPNIQSHICATAHYCTLTVTE